MGHLPGAVGEGSAMGGMAGGSEPPPQGASPNPRSSGVLWATRTGRGRGHLSDEWQSTSSFVAAVYGAGG